MIWKLPPITDGTLIAFKGINFRLKIQQYKPWRRNSVMLF
jgi:hypothetical protein